jgi:hypothetical protein
MKRASRSRVEWCEWPRSYVGPSSRVLVHLLITPSGFQEEMERCCFSLSISILADSRAAGFRFISQRKGVNEVVDRTGEQLRWNFRDTSYLLVAPYTGFSRCLISCPDDSVSVCFLTSEPDQPLDSDPFLTVLAQPAPTYRQPSTAPLFSVRESRKPHHSNLTERQTTGKQTNSQTNNQKQAKMRLKLSAAAILSLAAGTLVTATPIACSEVGFFPPDPTHNQHHTTPALLCPYPANNNPPATVEARSHPQGRAAPRSLLQLRPVSRRRGHCHGLKRINQRTNERGATPHHPTGPRMSGVERGATRRLLFFCTWLAAGRGLCFSGVQRQDGSGL